MTYIPEGATHEWTAAVPELGQRKYYKFQDGEWWSYSLVLAAWCPSNNDDDWFTVEIFQGYFKEIEHAKAPI